MPQEKEKRLAAFIAIGIAIVALQFSPNIQGGAVAIVSFVCGVVAGGIAEDIGGLL